MLTNILALFIYFAIDPGDFYRFRLSFKPTCITFNHYFFHLFSIVISVLLLALVLDVPWAPFIPQGLMFLYTLIRRPYEFMSDNLRSAFNYLTVCLITSMNIYYFYIGEEIKREMKNYIYPGAVELCLFIAVVWAYVVVIKDFVQKYYLNKEKKKNLAFDFFDEQETIRKVEKLVLNSPMYRPNTITDSFVINKMETSDEILKRKR